MTMKFEGFLGSFLTKAAQKPDQNFALFNGQPITFAAIDRQSAALASHFNARGLKRGDRAAVMMRNSELSLTVLFALARAGIVWVPVNAQQRGEGLRYILEHCEPGVVICDPDAQETIRECGAELPAHAFILTSGKDRYRILSLRMRGAQPKNCRWRTTSSQSCIRPALPGGQRGYLLPTA